MRAVVTTAGFLALAGVGVTYVVTDQQPSSVVGSPVASGAPTPTAASTAAGLPDTPILTPGAPPAASGTTAPEPSASTATPTAPTTTATAPVGSPTPAPTPTPTPTPTPRSRPVETLPSLDFTIGSFNVLGASHTTGRGSRPGYAPGTVRARGAAALLQRHRADVIGFQELQTSQLAALRRLTDLDFYPGSSLGRLDSENSIGWRRAEWVAVERHTVAIPYFNGGARAMPYVRLRNRSTGLEAWFANFHNPADTFRFRGQQAYRTRATLIEAGLVNRLLTDTGLPVLLTGDMNERGSYFCRLTSRSPLVAARGGSNVGGRCRAGGPRQVDWIFGSQGVQFSDYVEDDSRFVDRTTDHPVVTARARIQGNPGAGLGGLTGSTTGG